MVGYDPTARFRHADHTLANIFAAINKVMRREEDAVLIKQAFCEYLLLDALIGNTDRHHENWGLLAKQEEDGWVAMLAPSFDHASSLRRELRDFGPKKSRERFLSEDRVGGYSEKGRGAIYGNALDPHGLSPLELVRSAVHDYPDLFKGLRQKLLALSPDYFGTIVSRVPDECMSPLARTFAVRLLSYNADQLLEVLP